MAVRELKEVVFWSQSWIRGCLKRALNGISGAGVGMFGHPLRIIMAQTARFVNLL